jgi:protein SCO1
MRPADIFIALLLVASPVGAGIDPAAVQSLSFHQHPGARLPAGAQLIDSSGRPVSLGQALAGRPSLLVLEYLRCRNLCSLVLSGAAHAVASAGLEPGRDLDMVAISIDPREKSADAAAAESMYARRFPNPAVARTGIRFFTGSQAEVRRIASSVGFSYRYDKATDQFAHPAGFVITTPQARISRYMLGLNPKPSEIRDAVAEASRGAVEPPAHPLLLLCFGYDPDEGTVAALAMRLVRLVSAATMLGCLLLIGFLLLRRRPS